MGGRSLFFIILLLTMANLSAVSPRQLGLQAFNAMQELKPDKLQSLINRAIQLWKHDHSRFLDFINTRDSKYWTMLMIATALNDKDRISIIMDAAELVFGEDIQQLANVINARNNFGETAFYLAADFHNMEALDYLLEQAALIFKYDKALFFEFINAPELDDRWTPLMLVSFASGFRAVENIVKKAEEIFGRKSEYFDRFINAENIYGKTALSLALDDWIINFLKKNGAGPGHRINWQTYEDRHAFGHQLLHLVKHTEAPKTLQALLDEFAKKYPNDNHDYFHFLTTRDDGGWTAFMSAVADGNLELARIIWQAAYKYFKGDPNWLIYILITTDVHGRTPLHLAITRKHYKIVQELLNLQKEVSGDDKTLFAQFINYPNELTGFTPLIKASYISENTSNSKALLQLLLSRAQHVFGLNNAWFNRFINHRDHNGYTALSYVSVPALRDLLIKYGARDPLDPEYPPHLFKIQVLDEKN